MKKEDIEFMSSINSAILEQSTNSSKIILWVIAISITWLIIWASFAEVDELVRGRGKVIPSNKVQVVQNLEGGIVSQIYIQEGDEVKKNQKLLKINDIDFAASYKEGDVRIDELKAKSIRLKAESTLSEFTIDKNDIDSEFIAQEKSLYTSNKMKLESTLKTISLQINQKQSELKEMETKSKKLQRSLKLLKEEIGLTKPLVKKGVVSEIEFLKLQREASDKKGDLDWVKASIPRLKSTINEYKSRKAEVLLDFKSKAKKELNDVIAQISRIEQKQEAIEDQVKRTAVRSPVNGTIKKLFINTIGGVVKPGMNLVEIVPSDEALLIEAKIKPSDVAFLYQGQKAKVKFTAYDFSIYGGLDGEVTHISADTMEDSSKSESYYLVKIKTERNFLGTEASALKIKAGMIADVDIITGKKTIMQYILKPIIKAKQNALRER